MTVKDMVTNIGKLAMLLTAEGLSVPVKIQDAKHVYGTFRYRVTPEGGFGWAWVDAGRLKITESTG